MSDGESQSQIPARVEPQFTQVTNSKGSIKRSVARKVELLKENRERATLFDLTREITPPRKTGEKTKRADDKVGADSAQS